MGDQPPSALPMTRAAAARLARAPGADAAEPHARPRALAGARRHGPVSASRLLVRRRPGALPNYQIHRELEHRAIVRLAVHLRHQRAAGSGAHGAHLLAYGRETGPEQAGGRYVVVADDRHVFRYVDAM